MYSLDPERFEANARWHRECASSSRMPDLIEFHNTIAGRLERLAEDCRNIYAAPADLRI